MYTSMGRVAVIADAAAHDGPKSGRGLMQRVATEMSLDAVDMGVRTPFADRTSLMGTLRTVIDSTAVEREKKNAAGESKATATFDWLTAKAMLLHLDAQEIAGSNIDQRVRSSSEAILKASLGGLVLQTADAIEEFYASYKNAQQKGGTGDHLSGRVMETVYFGYRLMQWYKTKGSLVDGYTRFAFDREDRPHIRAKPSRSYDALTRWQDVNRRPELVQVKAWNGKGYAYPVEVWRPEYQGVVDETDQVTEAFRTIIKNEVSDTDVAAAWRTLHARFGEE
jgi:hypothetical protein